MPKLWLISVGTFHHLRPRTQDVILLQTWGYLGHLISTDYISALNWTQLHFDVFHIPFLCSWQIIKLLISVTRLMCHLPKIVKILRAHNEMGKEKGKKRKLQTFQPFVKAMLMMLSDKGDLMRSQKSGPKCLTPSIWNSSHMPILQTRQKSWSRWDHSQSWTHAYTVTVNTDLALSSTLPYSCAATAICYLLQHLPNSLPI